MATRCTAGGHAGTGEGPHPVLLMIHGGLLAQYTPAFFDEAQVYAEAGYAVVMCNLRGSSGYGRDHGRAIRFGDLDSADVLAFLEHAIATVPGLDGDRVGIMGGLTAAIDRLDHRPRPPLGGRDRRTRLPRPGVLHRQLDIGWFFPQQYNGDRERMDAQSPMLTPTP